MIEDLEDARAFVESRDRHQRRLPVDAAVAVEPEFEDDHDIDELGVDTEDVEDEDQDDDGEEEDVAEEDALPGQSRKDYERSSDSSEDEDQQRALIMSDKNWKAESIVSESEHVLKPTSLADLKLLSTLSPSSVAAPILSAPIVNQPLPTVTSISIPLPLSTIAAPVITFQPVVTNPALSSEPNELSILRSKADRLQQQLVLFTSNLRKYQEEFKSLEIERNGLDEEVLRVEAEQIELEVLRSAVEKAETELAADKASLLEQQELASQQKLASQQRKLAQQEKQLAATIQKQQYEWEALQTELRIEQERIRKVLPRLLVSPLIFIKLFVHSMSYFAPIRATRNVKL